jgi:flavin-dependent dehydrogenase
MASHEIRSAHMTDYDVAIIGGGPSGSTLGLLLAKAGYQTAIFDRDTFPRNKLCGEFIAPVGHRVLSGLDLIDTLRDTGGAPIKKYEITTRDNESLTDSFDFPGFAISRHRLDILLLREAKLAGADVFTGSRITDINKESHGQHGSGHTFHVDTSCSNGYPDSTGSAQLLIGAYGRRSSLDRKLNRPFFRDAYEYVGFQKHHYLCDAGELESDRVKLYLIPGGYCGIVKIEKNLVNVCLMVHTSSLPDTTTSWSTIRDTLLTTNPTLKDQLRHFRPAENNCRSVAQIPLMDKGTVRHPLLFTGDASGMVAPLTGSGQAMAIRSGQLLAELISTSGLPQNRKQFRELGERWSTIWSSSFSDQIRASRILNTLLQYDIVTDFAVKFLKRTPGLSTFLRRRVTSC